MEQYWNSFLEGWKASYTTAGDGQFQEVCRTVSDHLLEALHIQTKVLDKKTNKKTRQGNYWYYQTVSYF